MANDTIGTVPCAFCKATSPVRKNAKKKLYYVCPGNGDKACGIVQPNMPGFQEWILEHATLNGPAIDPPIEGESRVISIEKTPAPVAAVALPVGSPIRTLTVDDSGRVTKDEPTPQPKKPRGFGIIRF